MGFFDIAPSACFIDDLLNFNIDEAETVDGSENPRALPPSNALIPKPEFEEEEEELEWLSNKDVFPSVDTFVPCVETFVDMIPLESITSDLKHESPVSVLENSNSSFGSNNSNNSNAVITSCCSGRGLAPPIRRPRSKGFQRRQRGGFVDIPSQQWFALCSSIHANKTGNKPVKASGSNGITGRKCTHCGSEKTPQWRAGPNGPKTLCNACGVRYKSGRLCPEYRPANSPTFVSAVHSNSHRKIVEMKKMKQMGNMTINPVDNG
ncbi:unnamed protein product [Rhodiola kirilowii]